MIKWKEGDWAIRGYDVVQIKKVEKDGRVTDVSDGHFSLGSYDVRDTLRPLTLANKSIADSVNAAMWRLHRHKNNQGLNFPDIARQAEDFSVGIIDGTTAADVVWKFFREIEEFLDAPSPTVQGIRLRR